MKIAVLGANGFVGSSVTRYFANQHLVVPVTRSTINLLDPVLVKNWLRSNRFDIVINAATTMQDNTLLADTRNNLGLFMNFYNNRDLFKRFINFSSGAEFDRDNDINRFTEERIFDVMPSDSYGFGQNMKSRIGWATEEFYTIRIFNCFGLGEFPTRIFPRMLAATQENPLIITHDRQFDYFGVRDLCALTKYFVVSTPKVKDVNAVYQEKFKISQVIEKFCQLNNLEPNYRIDSTGGNRYTGSGRILSTLPVKLLGLDSELKHYNESLY